MTRKPIPKNIREQVYQKYDGHCAYCGCELRTYGIFTSKENAEKAKENIRKSKGPSKVIRQFWEGVTPTIAEFESDECVNEYLGGYEE